MTIGLAVVKSGEEEITGERRKREEMKREAKKKKRIEEQISIVE